MQLITFILNRLARTPPLEDLERHQEALGTPRGEGVHPPRQEDVCPLCAN